MSPVPPDAARGTHRPGCRAPNNQTARTTGMDSSVQKNTSFVFSFPTKQPFTSLREPEAHAQIEEQYGSSERRTERLAYMSEQLTPSFQRK
ncbi:hypothetical protein HBH56_045360 [Parastagonospora nodorum]|uniref:Uncharacterized protein n=1 Tax=Phaeosphaeria nodorum (strain SN15 / ATCC MYA-4574 / FGSC 10173) TaxID=321614 RepID=A0A7U2ETI5_PHANO|nr:hypothetical protein HBH56_045360 [Parastagonospora nodorum]QRC92694.1 hypothetical protein JI435_305770 [Parastagonospora nodorum SN15]KAH3933391.1 hypothetical protein HBH54_073110 [Parastagonospora nodorum]KAH3980913.1 hypothetical protein HBH51_051090 [Parastagonospora nodorum]KAH4004012.1 hypothetical protein HBI10_052100 [Parastagonospora nodorum]